MTGFVSVLSRELWRYWVTPLAWVLLVVFLVLQGASFALVLTHAIEFSAPSIDVGPLKFYFSSAFVHLTLMLICPALTMGVFAEERKHGTLETLLTAPVTPAAVTLGKYAAAWITFALIWLPTLLYVFILRHSGAVDWNVVGASLFGIACLGGMYLGIGVLMSAMTDSQLVALLLTAAVILGVFTLGIGEQVLDDGFARDVSVHLSVLSQLDEFSSGIIDLRRLVFDLSVTGLALFLCARVVDSWRWD
jgi:ABC-2 type transport system permease protein